MFLPRSTLQSSPPANAPNSRPLRKQAHRSVARSPFMRVGEEEQSAVGEGEGEGERGSKGDLPAHT
jgi:hypothetical protein